MNNIDGKELLKGLEIMKRQAKNLMDNTLTSDIMRILTPEQLAQVTKAKRDLKALDKRGLNANSGIFKTLK